MCECVCGNVSVGEREAKEWRGGKYLGSYYGCWQLKAGFQKVC